MEEEALSWYQCHCCQTLEKGFLGYFNVCSWCVRHWATRLRTTPAGVVRFQLSSCMETYSEWQVGPHLLTSIAPEMLHWVTMQVSGRQLGGPSFVSSSHLAKLQGPLQLSPKTSWVLPVLVMAHNATELRETASHLALANNSYWLSSLIQTPWVDL